MFKYTSGLHAAALFDAQGKLHSLREDVGRTMPMDKLNGWAILSGGLPLQDHTVLLSGRASFELLQKAIMARAPIVCAISSSPWLDSCTVIESTCIHDLSASADSMWTRRARAARQRDLKLRPHRV